ncbi:MULTISPECIES: fluoride efflux transporter CrcB [Altibacter]|uniref:fluoride efflux transporter CrcB n=1 Tax=Altibacter TaxID=1535231 RepID=UPI0005595995|nr:MULTISPECIES: fluoride efflux transporter CrcB [Altibacter]MCW8979909.1 fluoride efflux transporter CrcB [Altibacter sp.]MCW9037839.1 fluoride efflux transporter CrcB [Altibacter sp.]
MKHLLLVFLGGGLGSSLRYWIGTLLASERNGFPMATFAVNMIGSVLIGIILGFALKSNTLSQNTVLFLATGFCGGFTTFSAFAYENQIFLKSGDLMSFAGYTLGSLIIGIAAVFFGIWVVRLF